MDEIVSAVALAYPDLTIDAIESLGEGDFCRVFLINKSLVFRFAKHEAARRSLRREHCLLPSIARQITLETPQPKFFADAEAPNAFIVYRFLPDAALTRAEYSKQPEKSRSVLAGQVGNFLNELHSLETGTAEKCGIERLDYAAKYSALLSDAESRLAGRLEKADFDFIIAALENFIRAAENESFSPVLLHGDLSPDHVLFAGERVTSIIDFSDMMIGDAARDFLWIYEDYGLDFLARALTAYHEPGKEKFLYKIFRFSTLSAIEWTVETVVNRDACFSEALGGIRNLRLGGAKRLGELLKISGAV